LQSVGFTEEGVARGYLKIDGAWRDHVLYALLQDDPIPPWR
jgi:ribosomal-protein-alanine N-acetyltransferase